VGVTFKNVQDRRIFYPKSDNRRNDMNEQEKQQAIEILNNIMELELAGVVRYTHYSLMVYGYGRIPIVSCLREMLMRA